MVQNFLTAFMKHLKLKSFATQILVFLIVALSSLQIHAVSISSSAAPVPAKKVNPTKSQMKANRAKIAIIVNKEVITYQDIEDRARLVVMTSGMENTPETLRTVEQQVKKSLIDEKIQLMAAKLQKVFVAEGEVLEALKNIAKDNNMTIEQMMEMFKSKGVNIKTLKDRIFAQISWARTIREAFGAIVRIDEVEIKNAKKKLEDNDSKDQYELMEIFLRVENPSQQAAIKNEADRIFKQLQQGARFQVLAQQFSESTSSASGGYMGWFAQGQMDPKVEPLVLKLNPGEFTQPIQTEMGYKIIYLKDLKRSNQAPIGQTQLTYKQVVIPYHDNITNEQGEIIETHVEQMQSLKNCDHLEAKANEHGYVCETPTDVPLGSLPPPLQKIFQGAKINQCHKPIRTPEHLIVTMVCNRNTPTVKAPTDDEIRSMLEQEKFGKIATREFNKLHSVAFIEDKTLENQGKYSAAAAA